MRPSARSQTTATRDPSFDPNRENTHPRRSLSPEGILTSALRASKHRSRRIDQTDVERLHAGLEGSYIVIGREGGSHTGFSNS